MAISIQGMMFFKASGDILLMARAPAIDPAHEKMTAGYIFRQLISPAREKLMVEAAEPNIAWSLLVAMAETGGRPANRRAGTVINPPPPAMASKKPAANATAARMSSGAIAILNP